MGDWPVRNIVKCSYRLLNFYQDVSAVTLYDKHPHNMTENRVNNCCVSGGGYGGRVSGDDDNQTIRTEDFVDKFQDTMVYSSGE